MHSPLRRAETDAWERGELRKRTAKSASQPPAWAATERARSVSRVAFWRALPEMLDYHTSIMKPAPVVFRGPAKTLKNTEGPATGHSIAS